MIQEPAHKRQCIEWYELVEGALGQAFLRDMCGSDRCGREKHIGANLDNLLNQGKDCIGFTHRCGMNPNEWTIWSWLLGLPITLSAAGSGFLATCATCCDQ